MDEDAQQRITYLLQEIDANICAAHRSATQICGTVRRHHQILRQIHEASRVWRPLFDSFTQQPAARRATRTPSRFSRTATPGSRAVTQRVGGEDEELDDDSFVETFKTTTLKKHQPPPSEQRTDEDSLNYSISSDNLPRMSRTPYLSKSAVQSASRTQASSTLSSEDRSSPPRTSIISGDGTGTANAGPRQISTPPSAISSVEYSSPGISRNLMKIGAFEYTPPRGKKSRNGEEKEADESHDSIDTPDFGTVAEPDTIQTAQTASSAEATSPARLSEGASNRKRKRTDSGDKRRTPVYPKTHYPSSTSSPYASPSLRRKYSTANTSTPSRRRKPESHTPVTATPPRQSTEVNEEDTPRTPEFDLASPLLRTQLKAMTPNTPLSNRLVGASLDVGSVSQEAQLQDYDDSFNAGEPTPKFELSLLPTAFQRGVGAVQMSTLYSKFQGTNGEKPAISVDQLADLLPDYGKKKIEILVDTLVSRRLLRPFVVEGTMFWQQPL